VIGRPGQLLLALAAVAAGVTIAALDSPPGWDDTGITVVALVASAATVAFVSGRRPWLWGLLVGLPTPLVEIVTARNAGSLLALAFAVAGAAAGWAVRRAGSPRDRTDRDGIVR
jgi:hypothetical protein